MSLPASGAVGEGQAPLSAGRLRREPFVLLFPLGVALSWWGVGHWLLHALGLLADFRPRFHAIVQIQGFMTCLAAGFLLTMIPRRTGTAPASVAQVAVAAVGAVVVAAAAWSGAWRTAQAAWLVVVGELVLFILGRFARAEQRRPPNAFVWIPTALAMGMAGALLSIWSEGQAQLARWQMLGAHWLQQGMLIGLVLGVGSLALPLMTRGEGPPDGAPTARDRLARAAHLAGAAVMAASFWLEVQYGLRWGLAVRALVVTAVYLFGIELWRPPTRPGWNARVIQAAAWSVPLGLVVTAIWPRLAVGGLHIAFVGGFGLLGLAVSSQVILGHGGYRELLFGRPWPVAVLVGCVALATVARLAMAIDRGRYFVWMGLAAAAFLLATLAWAWFVVPGIVRPRAAPDGRPVGAHPAAP